MRPFVFTQSYYTKFIQDELRTTCFKCGVDFEIGDRICGSGKKSKRRYHVKCFESMFVR